MTEKFTPGELIACKSYSDNGTLSHYNFVDENGDIIGMFCDEDALIKRRMEREKAYANLFAAAPEMYAKLETVLALCDGGLLRKTRCDILGGEIAALLKKARGEQ